MIFGYARVSTKDQNLERQLVQLNEIVCDERNIIIDKTGEENFNRRGFNQLIGTDTTAPLLREGDLLVICSLDRLGRNYSEIQKQWQRITKDLKADIRVLDMPLLDTSNTEGNLDRRFIADLALQILSYSAEKERENIRKRKRQGIDVAKAQGKNLGRPKTEYPPDWAIVYSEWQRGELTATSAMKQLGIKRTTFYKLAKEYVNR